MSCHLGPDRCRGGWHWRTERSEIDRDRYYDYVAAVEHCPEWLRVANRLQQLQELVDDDSYTTIERAHARDEIRDRTRELKELEGASLPEGEKMVSREDILKSIGDFGFAANRKEDP